MGEKVRILPGGCSSFGGAHAVHGLPALSRGMSGWTGQLQTLPDYMTYFTMTPSPPFPPTAGSARRLARCRPRPQSRRLCRRRTEVPAGPSGSGPRRRLCVSLKRNAIPGLHGCNACHLIFLTAVPPGISWGCHAHLAVTLQPRQCSTSLGLYMHLNRGTCHDEMMTLVQLINSVNTRSEYN